MESKFSVSLRHIHKAFTFRARLNTEPVQKKISNTNCKETDDSVIKKKEDPCKQSSGVPTFQLSKL